jgi:hypothetical protein
MLEIKVATPAAQYAASVDRRLARRQVLRDWQRRNALIGRQPEPAVSKTHASSVVAPGLRLLAASLHPSPR